MSQDKSHEISGVEYRELQDALHHLQNSRRGALHAIADDLNALDTSRQQISRHLTVLKEQQKLLSKMLDQGENTHNNDLWRTQYLATLEDLKAEFIAQYRQWMRLRYQEVVQGEARNLPDRLWQDLFEQFLEVLADEMAQHRSFQIRVDTNLIDQVADIESHIEALNRADNELLERKEELVMGYGEREAAISEQVKAVRCKTMRYLDQAHIRLCNATAQGFLKEGVERILQDDTALFKMGLSVSDLVNKQDHYGNTPLHIACAHGHVEIVDYLLLQGANVNMTNERNCTPMQLAAGSSSREASKRILIRLYESGARESMAQLLFTAATWGNYDAATWLLGILSSQEVRSNLQQTVAWLSRGLSFQGVGPDSQRKIDGNTALHLAAQYGHTDIVKLLLSHGASTEIMNHEKVRPLHCAIHAGKYTTAAIIALHLGNFDRATLEEMIRIIDEPAIPKGDATTMCTRSAPGTAREEAKEPVPELAAPKGETTYGALLTREEVSMETEIAGAAVPSKHQPSM